MPSFSGTAADILSRMSELYDLIWTDIRVQVQVPVAVGGQPIPVPVVTPADVPFLLVDLGFSSIRPYDASIVQVDFATPERRFVDQPIPLEALCNLIDAGGPPGSIPPCLFDTSDRITMNFLRIIACDPAEAYPGLGQASIITVRLRGCKVYPKGSQPACAKLEAMMQRAA